MGDFQRIDIRPAREAPPSDTQAMVNLAKWLLAQRARRKMLFTPFHLDEPTWDMMLDLFVEKQAGRQIATTSLCVAADLPMTTALRHLTRMDLMGVINRSPDSDDRRRILVSLTDDAQERIFAYLGRLHCSLQAMANKSRV